jgi:hypothetical protein
MLCMASGEKTTIWLGQILNPTLEPAKRRFPFSVVWHIQLLKLNSQKLSDSEIGAALKSQ